MTDTLAAIVAELRETVKWGRRNMGQRSFALEHVLTCVTDTTNGLEALSRSGAGGGWQPIATAPDRKDVLVFLPECGRWPARAAAARSFGGTCIRGSWSIEGKTLWKRHPTHWQPLPAPPQAGEGTGEK